MVHIPTIVMWVVSTITFLYGDYWSRDVAPAWSQYLLGASADPRVRQDPAGLLANITASSTHTTTTTSAWVTVVALPASTTATAASIMPTAASLVTGISTRPSHFQHSANSDASVIVFALALAILCSLAILRQMSLPRASDLQLDCTIMAAHISQQNLCIEEMGLFQATLLARFHRQMKDLEKENRELRAKTAELNKATLGLHEAETEVDMLKLEVEAARNEALVAGWKAEEKADSKIDELRKKLKGTTSSLAAAKETIQARDRRITELEAANEATKAATQDSGEVRSLRDSIKTLEADLVAVRDVSRAATKDPLDLRNTISTLETDLETARADLTTVREEAWDAADKAKRSDAALKTEIASLAAAITNQGDQTKQDFSILHGATDELNRVVEARNETIAGLRAELEAMKMKAALDRLPSVTVAPAGSQEAELRRRLAAASEFQREVGVKKEAKGKEAREMAKDKEAMVPLAGSIHASPLPSASVSAFVSASPSGTGVAAAASASGTPVAPVVVRRRPRPVTSAMRPIQRPGVKKAGSGAGAGAVAGAGKGFGGVSRGPQPGPEA